MDKHDAIIQKLSEDVSYLRGRFDTAIPMMQQSAEDIRTILKSQEERIGGIEQEQSVLKGKVLAIGGIISIAGTVGANWFIKHFV